MTRDDAIKIFNTVLCLGKCDCSKDEIEECLKMAIEALKQQPNEDWNAVLDELNRIGRNAFKDDTDYDNLFNFISNLPNVTPQPKEHTEERTETHECDCINRDARGKKMNEFTKIRDRILARIETYIADIEFAEEQELTEDEKTIFESVKEIINEEFEGTIPLPRFIIHKDEKMKQVEAADEKIKLTDEEMKKFMKFVNDYKGIPAEDKQRICQDAIRTTDAIIRLSHSYGVSYYTTKDMVMETMETLKKSKTDTAKWVIAGVSVDCLGYRFKMYKCSNCGHIDNSHRKNKFCPNCGRRMEG